MRRGLLFTVQLDLIGWSTNPRLLLLRLPRYIVGGPAAIWAATWGAIGREPFTPTTTQRSLKTSRLYRRLSLAAVNSAASTSGTAWFSVSRVPGRGPTSNNRSQAFLCPTARGLLASTRLAPSPRGLAILGTTRCFTPSSAGLV